MAGSKGRAAAGRPIADCLLRARNTWSSVGSLGGERTFATLCSNVFSATRLPSGNDATLSAAHQTPNILIGHEVRALLLPFPSLRLRLEILPVSWPAARRCMQPGSEKWTVRAFRRFRSWISVCVHKRDRQSGTTPLSDQRQ